jgi:hypothetical protein
VLFRAIDEKASVQHVRDVLASSVAYEFVGKPLTPRPLPLDVDPGAPHVPRTGTTPPPVEPAPAERPVISGMQGLIIIVLLILITAAALYVIIAAMPAA